MSTQDLAAFYGRVARFEKARALGYGFEANGTLGRSFYNKSRRKRPAIFGPLLIVATCVFGLKAAIHYKVGAADYADRVAQMQDQDGFSRLGATLMQVDPLTVYLSETLGKVLR